MSKRRNSKRFFGLSPLLTTDTNCNDNGCNTNTTMTKERITLQKLLSNQSMSLGADFCFDDVNLGQGCKTNSRSHSHSHGRRNKHGHPDRPERRDLSRLDCSHNSCSLEHHHDHSQSYHHNNKNGNNTKHCNITNTANHPMKCTPNDNISSGTSDLDYDYNNDIISHCDVCEDESFKQESRRAHLRIAQREDCHVKIIKRFTLLFIFSSAFLVCFLAYDFAKDHDQQDFESHYSAHVESIQNDVTWEIKCNLALMKQLGTTITSTIVATSQSPPFVTLPRFEVLGGFTEGLGGIMRTSFIPLISNSQKSTWEDYSVDNQDWLEESARLKATHSEYQRPLYGTTQDHETDPIDTPIGVGVDTENIFDIESVESIPDKVWFWEGGEKVPLEKSLRDDGLIAPLWQISPADPTTINIDLFSVPGFANLYDSMIENNGGYPTVMSQGFPIGDLFDGMVGPREELEFRKMEPHAFVLEPLFANFTSKREVVASSQQPIGLVLGLISYKHLFERVLPEGGSVYVVLTSSTTTSSSSESAAASCGTNLTYFLNGPEAVFVGYHNLHEELEEYQDIVRMGLDAYEIIVPLHLSDLTATDDVCKHTLHIYPSPAFKELYSTDKARTLASISAMTFLVMCFCFLVYERLVTRREKTKNAALKVVASLFPSGVQEAVLKGVEDGHHGTPDKGNVIASFFPATTIMFADISGFTAWSSTRDPEQVFRLLETVYGAMDEIAIRLGVFKVETVGDCYVACCGLPEPREDHAVVMIRFARDCQLRMASLGQQLEIALGPDTADLSFRIGIHSGSVTGGVLRGQNARFQLFGDTMNQASRMESTGVKDRIQISTTTAKLLIDSGKAKWIEKRSEKVDVKGKGLQETYFLREESGSTGSQSVTSKSSSAEVERPRRNRRPSIELIEPVYKESNEQKKANKNQRLVTWNTEVLLRRVRSIVHQREHASSLDHSCHNTTHIKIGSKVVDQLQRHVQHMASMYRENPFHNYEHASHVTLSMEKMLSNVKSVETSHCLENISGEFTINSLNAYTSDLTNDPLAQFAVVYSALIHDVDHLGCSNSQLVKEKDKLAIQYNGKSPAENHSINLAWTTLMLPDYKELVDCLCPTTAELERLKELVTNAVLATDIFDVDLIKNRNMRWEQVFGGTIEDTENNDKLRVMIVLDHLIQASDVAHTMQHWHVYIKWNERLFHEMSDAYQQGRLAKDPAKFWYEGELDFFDKYVIPLAKKLLECGVFGVSCCEFLNYAETNRNEWETKGRDIVKDFAKLYQAENPPEENRPSRQPRTRSIDACDIRSRISPPTGIIPLAPEERSVIAFLNSGIFQP